jgi:hypothetical protein
VKPDILASYSLWPRRVTTCASKCATTKTVCTDGFARSQLTTCLFQVTHCARRLAGSRRATALLSGQPERVTDRPRHLNSCATFSSAARQCAAWLSPSSATVLRAASACTPNSHGITSPIALSGRQGRLGEVTASSGEGTTLRASLGLRQPERTSREAAPKQRSRSSGATDSVTFMSTSPVLGRKSSQPSGARQVLSSKCCVRARQ